MTQRRKKGVQLCFPIVYGNSAVKLEESSSEYKQLRHTHRWTVYLRGCNQEDLTYYVQKVTFKLHESFENPIRTVTRPPFEITQTGWGEFEIQISVYLHDFTDRPIKLSHMLRLFPVDKEHLQQERIHQVIHPVKKSSPIIVVEQMDEIVMHEPTEAFYEMALEKFQTETYPLNGQVFNRKTELQELERLQKAHEHVLHLLDQYQRKIEETEEKIYHINREKGSFSSANGGIG